MQTVIQIKSPYIFYLEFQFICTQLFSANVAFSPALAFEPPVKYNLHQVLAVRDNKTNCATNLAERKNLNFGENSLHVNQPRT